jgi:hypothetical protein
MSPCVRTLSVSVMEYVMDFSRRSGRVSKIAHRGRAGENAAAYFLSLFSRSSLAILAGVNTQRLVVLCPVAYTGRGEGGDRPPLMGLNFFYSV